MGSLSFLFQGQQPAQGTNYNQNQSQVPTWLQQYTQGILAQSNALASQPYQPYGGPRIAGFSPAQQQAQQEVQDLQGQYRGPLAQAQQLATSSSQPAAVSNALGYLPLAQSAIQGAMSPTAAMMNPYTQNVIQKAEDDASRYFTNTLQPQINNQFTAAGQFNSSANQRAQDLTAQQLTQQVQDTAGSALSQAFQNAQQVGLQGASQLGALGQIGGGLGYEQGVLGLQGASQLGALGQLGQTLGLQGAGALDTIGGEQQNQNQQNLNLGYQDFLNQQQYPYQQASWLSQMLQGTATPTTVPGLTQQAYTQYAPATGSSPLQQALGMYAGLNPQQFGSSVTGAARGGSITPLRASSPRRAVLPLAQLREAA